LVVDFASDHLHLSRLPALALACRAAIHRGRPRSGIIIMTTDKKRLKVPRRARVVEAANETLAEL
jgi:hypothetical protein